MQTPACRVLLSLALCALATGCATRSLPKYEKPLARAPIQKVRTTAYTHTEGDHRQYANRNACGDRLQYGDVKSAACDWSRWPVGTVFRIQETGETFEVDDYGWALAGTNTIDLYKPSRAAMNSWGVRRVNIEIVQWGDVDRSLSILNPRTKHAHVRRMVTDLRRRYAELSRPVELPVASVASGPVAPSVAAVAEASESPRAVAVASTGSVRPSGGFTPPSRVPLTPFNAAR